MIYVYAGKIRSGKTLHTLIYEIIPALRENRTVYTNADLKVKRISEFLGKDISGILHIVSDSYFKENLKLHTKDFTGFKFDANSLLVIDEAQVLYDSRDYFKIPQSFSFLLEYHGHRGLDMIFITQDTSRLFTPISKLMDEFYVIKSARFAKVPRYIKYSYLDITRSERLSRQMFSYEEKYFPLYKSFVKGSKMRHRSRVPLTAVGFAIAIIFFLYIGLTSFGGSILGKKYRKRIDKPLKSSSSVVKVSEVRHSEDFRDSLAPLHLPKVARHSSATRNLYQAFKSNGLDTSYFTGRTSSDLNNKDKNWVTINNNFHKKNDNTYCLDNNKACITYD